MCGRERAGVLGFLLLTAATAAPLRAQVDDAVLPAPRLVLVAGLVSPDFGETDPVGDGSLVGARLDFPLAPWAVLEASAERLALDSDDGTSVRWQLDFATRGEIAVGRVLHPFVGASVGALLRPGDARPPEADFVVATYGGLAGVRADVTPRVGVRAEARFRWLDGLKSSTRTFDAGVSWRF